MGACNTSQSGDDRMRVKRTLRGLAVAGAVAAISVVGALPANAAVTGWLYDHFYDQVGNCYVDGVDLAHGATAYEGGFGNNCPGNVGVQARYLSAGSVVHTTSWDYDAWYATRTYSSSYINYGYKIYHS